MRSEETTSLAQGLQDRRYNALIIWSTSLELAVSYKHIIDYLRNISKSTVGSCLFTLDIINFLFLLFIDKTPTETHSGHRNTLSISVLALFFRHKGLLLLYQPKDKNSFSLNFNRSLPTNVLTQGLSELSFLTQQQRPSPSNVSEGLVSSLLSFDLFSKLKPLEPLPLSSSPFGPWAWYLLLTVHPII